MTQRYRKKFALSTGEKKIWSVTKFYFVQQKKSLKQLKPSGQSLPTVGHSVLLEARVPPSFSKPAFRAPSRSGDDLRLRSTTNKPVTFIHADSTAAALLLQQLAQTLQTPNSRPASQPGSYRTSGPAAALPQQQHYSSSHSQHYRQPNPHACSPNITSHRSQCTHALLLSGANSGLLLLH